MVSCEDGPARRAGGLLGRTTTMPLDSYVTLGRSGLRVSPFTLGTMTFGEDWGWGASAAESEAMLDDYLERGGNFIDTANVYTNGHAETIVGDYLRPAARAARPGRHRLEVLRQPVRGRSERGRRRPQGDRAAARAVAAAPARPTTSTSTGCTTGIAPLRSRRRCGRSMTSSPRARSATSASPTCRRGRPLRRRCSRSSAAGRRSSPCNSSTPCSNGPSKAS